MAGSDDRWRIGHESGDVPSGDGEPWLDLHGPLRSESGSMVVTVEEAARQLGLGRTKTYGLVMSGLLGSFTVGRRRLVPRSEIEAFIQRQMTLATDEGLKRQS